MNIISFDEWWAAYSREHGHGRPSRALAAVVWNAAVESAAATAGNTAAIETNISGLPPRDSERVCALVADGVRELRAKENPDEK